MKLIDVKRKDTKFTIFLKNKDSKWSIKKDLKELVDFHNNSHLYNQKCALCPLVLEGKEYKIKSNHVISFIENVINDEFSQKEVEDFLGQERSDFQSTPLPSKLSKPELKEGNSLISVSQRNPKPKYSEELVDELHRIKHQLALQDSFTQQGKFMEVKIKYNSHYYVLILNSNASFDDLIKKLKRKMALTNEIQMKFIYQDNENDSIIVEDEEDFSIAVRSKMKEESFLMLEAI